MSPYEQSVRTQSTALDLPTWIREHGVGGDALDLDAPLDDLEPLRDIVGAARVVGLGESSHHVREFYQLRHRMLRFLVQRCGFTAYVLEAPFTAGGVLDAWVHGGTGTAQRAASEGVAMSLGDVAELHQALAWMRSYNERGPDTPLRCVGADLPGSLGSPLPALQRIVSYVHTWDPATSPVLARAIALAEQFHAPSAPYAGELATYPAMAASDRDALTAALSELVARMERLASQQRRHGHAGEHSEAEHQLRGAWLLDQVHRSMLTDGIEVASTFRDVYIARSVLRLLAADPDARVVLAAHNWHIQKTPEDHDGRQLIPAGYHLLGALGDGYRPIGMTSRDGHTGVANTDALDGSNGFLFREALLPPPEDAAVESAFGDDSRWTMVDLRTLPQTLVDPPTHPRMRMADYFVDQPAWSAFDGLIAVRATTGTANTRG